MSPYCRWQPCLSSFDTLLDISEMWSDNVGSQTVIPRSDLGSERHKT